MLNVGPPPKVNGKLKYKENRKIEMFGYDVEILKQIRHAIDADTSDLLDVLEYISFATLPIERAERAERLKVRETYYEAQRVLYS